MPAPRSRRSARASQRQAAPADDDIEVVEPEATDEYAAQDMADAAIDPVEDLPEEEDRASSSRRSRAGGKSSRMSASERRNSARKSMKGSARKPALSPEELAKRRAARMLVVKLLLGVTVGLGAAFGIWWFGLRTPEAVNRAQQAIAAARQYQSASETAIKVRNPVEAEKSRIEAMKVIEIKELNFAKEGANPEDPELASLELAATAAELSTLFDTELKAKVEQLEQDIRVEGNLRRVQTGFGRLTGKDAFSDPELSTFEREVHEFLDNPVLPGAGANVSYQEEYVNEVKQIKYEVAKIEREKARRASEITDIPVRDARAKAAILVQKSRFQEALATVDEMQRTFENADFAGVRQFIRDAAELAWNSDFARAQEHYTTYKAPGTTPALADAALKAARDIMQHVVDNFGIPDYVNKAEAALKSFTK